MPRRNRERVEPALLEYSFDDCPLKKLSSCCDYEYFASSQLVLDAVERFRAGQNDRLAKSVALLFGADIYWTLAQGLWPRPYQSLLMEQRSRASSHQPKRRQPGTLAELVTPWTYLLDPKEAERIVPVYVNPYLPLAQLKKALAELLLRDYPHLLSKSVQPRFKAAFADLLRRKEPQFFEEILQAQSKRGRGSPSEQCRADLKALSAWRLSRRFGYSAQAAIDLMRAHRLSIYQDVTSFRRGVRRAAQRIAALEQRLYRYAER